MIQRFLKGALLTTLFCVTAAIADTTSYEEGKHYVRLDQAVRTQDSAKIEVVELFWYGCPHCYHFEPLVKPWKATLPADVNFFASPAMWNNVMRLHAKAFYTAKALKALDKLHEPLFTTLVVDKKKLNSEKDIETLFVEYGVDRETFKKAFSSFGINSQVTQADARARSYKITGTPEMVVNGKYRVSAKMAGGQPEMLQVVNYLIEQERKLLADSAN